MPKKTFYECEMIQVYADRGVGCKWQGWKIEDRIHPIGCDCPIRFLAKNNRNEKLYLNASHIYAAVAIVKGHGFDTEMMQKTSGYHVLYKI